MRWGVIIILILGLVGGWWQPSYAQLPSVLINEVMHYPSTGAEWVELYNPGALPIDLSGWRIDDATIGGLHTIIAEGTIIPPGDLLVIELSNPILNNNDPDQVQLSDRFGNVIDQSPLAIVSRDQTIARQPDGSPYWQIGPSSRSVWNGGVAPTMMVPSATSETVTATVTMTATGTSTPTATIATDTSTPIATPVVTTTPTKTVTPTVTATATPAVDQVIITEIAAAGEVEWIELTNRGEDTVVVVGWV
ncbi:MAG: lamin tail domain-containing protein, partial [Chloroflexi bacterium]